MWTMKLEQLAAHCGGELRPGTSALPHVVTGVCTDSRALAAGQLFVPLKGERFDGHDFLPTALSVGGAVVLVHRSFEALHKDNLFTAAALVVDDTLAAFRRLAAAMRHGCLSGHAPKVLAVGGSNGKTTTKEMIVSLLGGRSEGLLATRKSENGYVGIPKTLCSDDMGPKISQLVLEVGIDDVGSMAEHVSLVQPDVTLLTSLSHEHLEGLGSLDQVVREELVLMDGPWVRIWQLADERILQEALPRLRWGDWCVVPLDARSPNNVAHLRAALIKGCGVLTYQVETSADLSQRVELVMTLPALAKGYATSMEPLRGVLSLALPGRHNAANLALAMAASMVMVGVDGTDHHVVAQLTQNFGSFKPPELRSNLEHFADGSVMLVDCYNANPASVRASLESLHAEAFQSHEKIVFLGDMLDLGAESERLHDDLIFDLESMPKCQLYLYGHAMYPVYIKCRQQGLHAGLFHLRREDALEQWLQSLPPKKGPVFVLVKGSRGMAMERLLPGLRAHLEQT
jgi:UDP-N-acetylmuramoyl-tripeptide--D-alanyl-D-alanine ligase